MHVRKRVKKVSIAIAGRSVLFVRDLGLDALPEAAIAATKTKKPPSAAGRLLRDGAAASARAFVTRRT
jgi:hypothetical protein